MFQTTKWSCVLCQSTLLPVAFFDAIATLPTGSAHQKAPDDSCFLQDIQASSRDQHAALEVNLAQPLMARCTLLGKKRLRDKRAVDRSVDIPVNPSVS